MHGCCTWQELWHMAGVMAKGIVAHGELCMGVWHMGVLCLEGVGPWGVLHMGKMAHRADGAWGVLQSRNAGMFHCINVMKYWFKTLKVCCTAYIAHLRYS